MNFTIDATTLHRVIGMLGGKKLLVVIAGMVLWYLNAHGVHVPPEILTAPGVSDVVSKIPSDGSGWHLAVMVAAYLIGQGVADGMTDGKTSSVVAASAAAAPETSDDLLDRLLQALNQKKTD